MGAAEDRAEIQNLLAEYCLAADQERFADWARCYATDGEMHAFRRVWKGRQELEEFISNAPLGIHLCGLPRIELDGDRASAGLPFVFFTRDRQVFSMGFYDDDLVRCSDGWRIASRRIDMVRKPKPAEPA